MKSTLSMGLLICIQTVAFAAKGVRPLPAGTGQNGAPAQPSPLTAQNPAIHVEVRQVLVPVVVTDSKGHNVPGLGASNFQVFEDGVEQRLVSVTSEADGAARLFEPAAPVPAPGTAPINAFPGGMGKPERVYLVAIDTLNSEFSSFEAIHGALKKFFADERPDAARYALVAMSQNTSVVQPLTADPSAVLRALQDKQFARFILASEQSNLAQQETQLRRMLEDFCQKCPCATGQCSKRFEVQRLESFAAAAGEEQATQMRNFFQQLRGLVEQLGTVAGKRTIILISDGFTIQPGHDLFELISIYLNDPKIAVQDPQARIDSEMDAVLRQADARSVTFYTLDSRGAYVVPPGGYDLTGPPMSSKTAPRVMPEIQSQENTSAVERDDGLRELAEATGGLFFGNSNDALKGIRRAFADGRAYYLLAYTSSNPATDGKFRKIQVVMDQKNLRVRARQGYWAPAR